MVTSNARCQWASLGSAMTHEVNALLNPTPAGDGRVAMVWAAELDGDELGAIGFESACPALQASYWGEAAAACGGPADLS
jgi:hypothetical protein